jgi:hypothetical protein
MTLLDLSQVTRTLVTLLETHIQASPVWPAATPLTVSPDPPDRLTGDNTLGLYLYHLAEDPHNKNMLPPGNSQPPIRYTPMPLNLYYQLSAHSDLNTPTGAYREQLMMGCALKALHDYPVITEATHLGATDILAPALRDRDNRLHIELRPVSPDEAVTFWTAGSSPLRLASYVRVSIVMLEPDEPDSGAGRVLAYNVFAFPSQTPRIDSSANTLIFTVPGEADPREIIVRPAQVPIGGQVHFDGSSLTGDQTAFLLHHALWPAPIEVNPAAWALQATAERVSVTVQDTAGPRDIIPGIYGAVVRATRRRPTAAGATRDFEYFSNQSPFAISPRIDGLTAPTPAGDVTVTGRLFQHADLPPDAVAVYLGDTRLTAGAGGALNPAEFAAMSPTQLDFRLPAGLAPGQLLPFRLVINGAESPPRWVITP